MLSKTEIFKQTIFNRINQQLKSVKMYQIMESYFKRGAQLSFKSFCHLFILYGFGELFPELDYMPNLLYKDLRHLNLLDTAYSACCRGTMFVYHHQTHKHSDVENNYIPVNACTLSSYGIKCLKTWHVFAKFSHFVKQLSKKNQLLRWALAKPFKKRQYHEITYGEKLPPSYTFQLTKQLRRLWRKHSIRALDLIKGTNSKGISSAVRDLHKVIYHRSMISADCFLNTLKPVFKKRKLIAKHYVPGFGILYLYNVHTTYNHNNVDLYI